MLLSWHCSFRLFLVGMWAGHVSIICSMVMFGNIGMVSLYFLSLGLLV